MIISKSYYAQLSYASLLLKRRKVLAITATAAGSAALMFTVATAHAGVSHHTWGGTSGTTTSGTSGTSGATTTGTGGTTTGATGGTTTTGTGGSSTSGTREPFNQPFSSISVWNVGIGSNAQWSASTDQDTAQLNHANSNVNSAEWSIPYYIGSSTDPLVTVTDTDDLYPVPPQQIYIPSGATPAAPVSGGDHHMTFYDKTQPTKLFAYYGCSFNNGSNVSGGLTCKLANVSNVCGDGVNGAVGASRYDWYIGTISQADIAKGVINHALRYTVSTDIAKSPGPVWNQNIPWPNDNEDYWGPTGYTGYLAFGSTIGIPQNVNLSNLGLSAGGLMLANALQKYGAIMRDTGGTDQIAFYVDPAAGNNTLVSQMESDVSKLVPLLRVMRNQSSTTVNGGGAPIAPTPAPLDQSICTGAS